MIIGIDPGPETQSFVALQRGHVFSHFEGNLSDTFRKLYSMREQYGNVLVAVEHMQHMGMSVGREVFETAYNVGAIRQFCLYFHIKFARIFRDQVKRHLCGRIQGGNKEVRAALMRRFEKPALKGIQGHLWSALAVAASCHDFAKNPHSRTPATVTFYNENKENYHA